MSTALAAAAANSIDIDPILTGLRYAQKALADAAKYGTILAGLTATTVDDKVAAVLGQAAELVGTILANEELIALVRLIVGDPEVATLRDEARTARIATLASASPAGAKISPDQIALIIRFILSFLGKR